MSFGGFEYPIESGGGAAYNNFDPMGGGGGYGFNAGGFDGGGGFMTENAGGFVGEQADSSADKKKMSDRQNLIPLSIKQVLAAGNDEYGNEMRIDGAEVHTVKLVGTVLNMQSNSTNVVFNLTDGNNTIECKLWVDKASADGSKLVDIRDGALVRVVGNPRDYEGKRHLLVYNATELKDWNELTHHILDVIYTHLLLTQQVKIGVSPPTAAPQFGQSTGFGSPAMCNRGSFGGAPGPLAQGPGAFGGFTGAPGMSAGGGGGDNIAEKVYEMYVRHGKTQEGLPMNNVLMHLKTSYPNIPMPHQMEINRIIQQLCDEGRLYSTIDEVHHTSTGD